MEIHSFKNAEGFPWLDNAKSNDDAYCLDNMKNWSLEIRDFISDTDTVARLENFVTSDEKSILFKNCPIGNLPDTPVTNGYIENEHVMKPVKFLFGLFALLGIHPISYIGENQGKAIRHVVPKINRENQIGSHGSLEFNYHVDNPDLLLKGEQGDRSPCLEYLALYCLRGDQAATTELVDFQDIIEHLSEEDINLALSNDFIIQRPDSFEDGNPSIEDVPLVIVNNGRYFSRYDYHNVSAKSDAGTALLTKIKEIHTNTLESKKIIFEQGDLLIFKNQETLHKRSHFIPDYNGSERWLLRLFGAENLPYQHLNNQLVLKN